MSGIFGNEDMTTGGLDRAPSVTGMPVRRKRNDDELEKKQVVLAVAVTATTLVIVAAWLLTLPMQFDRSGVIDEDSVARWYVIREQMQYEGDGLQAQLDRIKEQLEEAAGDLEIASGSAAGAGSQLIPTDVAERLRDKIMEHESINQTEQDATTQEDQQ